MRLRQLLLEQQVQVTTPWMKRIARDHYEGTFLEGPYFDAADPDFLTLCMHVSPAAFTWGNTASSCVAELPAEGDGIPIFWWTPGPPCVGCYVPFFVHGSRLPSIVSRAGTAGKSVVRPDTVDEDSYASDSYWWLFRRLLDIVKGDPFGSRPGYYEGQQPIVRARFDALEQAFARDLPAVVERALAKRDAASMANPAILDEFTAACVRNVTVALAELFDELS